MQRRHKTNVTIKHILILVGLLVLLLVVFPVNASKGGVRINEILPNPEKGADEFIELYNSNQETVNLKDWYIEKTNKKGVTKKHIFKSDDEIKNGEYLKINFGGLNNDGAGIELISNNEVTISSKEYKKVIKGKSFNYGKEDWYWVTPTAGEKNEENPADKEYLKIIINEILPNPEKGDDEFIELYNPNDKNVDLQNWQLRDGSKNGEYVFEKETFINANKYLVVYQKDFGFGLDNAGRESVKLLSPSDKHQNGESTHRLIYTKTIKGKSYNYDSKKKKWYWANSTAGIKNEENPADKKYPKLILSEILPNPKGDEENDEYVEIYNPNKKEVSLKDWQIKDGSTKGGYTFAKDKTIKAGEYLVVYRKDFKFALNNSGNEDVKLVAPNYKIISSIAYKGAKESISYNYNLESEKWRWSRKITPGRLNKFNHLPTFKFKKPKRVYKNMYTEFSIHKLKDKDNDKVKIAWDFGDGHKSYIKETKHKYKKTGRYRASLIIKDGSEEIVKEFRVDVKKYPKYKVRISSIMPNPIGKDSGREIIIIKNLEKKKINLKGYKIATGKSENKIIGHLIKDDFIIEAGEIETLSNQDICKFNLLNTQGIVQIIYPNEKIADEIVYSKHKILPNEQYIKGVNSNWYWTGAYEKKLTAQSITQVKVLGVNTTKKNLDITLNYDKKSCNTKQQIKVDNFLDELSNDTPWEKIMGSALRNTL